MAAARANRSSDRLLSSLISFFLVLLAATVFADTSPVNRESHKHGVPTLEVSQSPVPKQGLNYVMGSHGLESLSFKGQSLLASP